MKIVINCVWVSILMHFLGSAYNNIFKNKFKNSSRTPEAQAIQEKSLNYSRTLHEL